VTRYSFNEITYEYEGDSWLYLIGFVCVVVGVAVLHTREQTSLTKVHYSDSNDDDGKSFISHSLTHPFSACVYRWRGLVASK
jgi:hypothetical protein